MLFFIGEKMSNINNLICLLLALQNYCKDIHYNSKGDAFYSKHLLADRIQDNISDYIDRIKEVFFLAADKEPLKSAEYLKKAAEFVPEISGNDKESFERLKDLLIKTMKQTEKLSKLTKGEENLIGTIAEDLQNSLGLVNRQVKDNE